jgi:sortase B
VQLELAEYAPSPQVIAAMEEKILSLQTTSVTTTQTEKLTEFSHISTCEVKTEASVTAINTTTQTVLTTTTQTTAETEILSEIQNQIAWLYIPETNINHPVMYSGDNEFYLHRAYDGSYLYAGSVFLDGRCSPDFSGTVSILYGHHMNNGSMFADVEKFMDEAFFEYHPYGWLFATDTTYCVEFISAALVDHTDALYATELTQPQRIDLLKEKSTQFRDISVTGNDRLLTLSTCSTADENLRVIVTGRLIPVE